MGKKKFIEKKKSATFQLISKDSSDPNYHEGPSGDRVFVRVDNNHFSVNSFFEDTENAEEDGTDSIFADAPDDIDHEYDGNGAGEVFGNQIKTPAANGTGPLPDHVIREILELGFPDDGYNYLTHLREIKNTGGGSAYYENSKAKIEPLPVDVKAYDASRVQIPIGDPSEKSIYSVASKTVGVRIQKAADPEVAALLDDDSDLSRFGSDVEELEEDFVVKANLLEDVENVEYDNKMSLIDASELNKEKLVDPKSFSSQNNFLNLGDAYQARNNLPAKEDNVNEEPRVRRLLDEQFDMLELQEYDTDSEDDYNGSIDEEETCHESLSGKLNHVLKDQAMGGLGLDSKYRVPSDLLNDNTKSKDIDSLDSVADVISRCKEYGDKYENEDEDENVIVQESSDESENQWDCETIITTYSNLDNHPGKIEAPDTRKKKKLAETKSGALSASDKVISLKGKLNLPVDFLPGSKKSAKNVKNDIGVETEPLNRKLVGQESKEEKKERKAAIKEERREARRLKKETKGLYMSEGQRAQKTAAFAGPSSIHLM